MSYPFESPVAAEWPLPGRTDDVIERLTRATDVLDLLRRGGMLG